MRRAFLQENNTLLYDHLILTEKLYPHLWEIQETATARMEQMMAKLLKANPGTGQEIEPDGLGAAHEHAGGRGSSCWRK